MKKLIAVGSTSPHKIAAVHEAAKRMKWDVEVVGYEVDSGQNPQPVGFDEMFKGALTRAMKVRGHYPHYICVGIENGLLRELGISIDLAVIVVQVNNQYYYATSPGITFPEQYVERAAERGFEKGTVGQILKSELGADATDPHVVLTEGKLTRTRLLAQGLVAAFAQIEDETL